MNELKVRMNFVANEEDVALANSCLVLDSK